MAQSITLPAAGLMTDPGPFTAAPEGGMVEAQNVVILRPGVIEPRPGTQASADASLKADGYEAHEIFVGGDYTFVVAADAAFGISWRIRELSSTTITGPQNFVRGKIRAENTGGRLLLTSEDGVASLPHQPASPEYGDPTIAYHAGMPQPYAPRMFAVVRPTGYSAAADWLANGESVAYRVTLRRRMADGTIVESAPSARVVVTNSLGVAAGVALNDVLGTGVYYAWAPNGAGAFGWNDLLEGDELCIYRSPNVVGTPTDEMRLRAVLTYDLTYNGFTTIVNGVATQWFDGMPSSAWTGAALYTNETQEGAFLANYRPEYARDIALYKDMTFYAGAQTSHRVELALKKVDILANVSDPQNAICSFAFTGDITSGTNTILNCTNIRYFSVGQEITLTAQAPGSATPSFPAGTYVTAINVTTNTVTLSGNAGATTVGAGCVAWDWIDISVPGARIYHYGGVGTLPGRYFSSADYVLDNRWNGDNATSVQLRCAGVTPTTEIACTWSQPLVTDLAFTITSSKPLAWDRYVDSVTGVTSEKLGGVADLQWSKIAEPEHCPIPYRTTVGDAAKPIRRILVARQSLLIFKDDGLFQFYGTGPQDYQIELVDSTVQLTPMVSPFYFSYDGQANWVARFDDRVFAMTTRGPMAITDTGAQLVGAPILETLRQILGPMMNPGVMTRAMMVDPSSRRVGFFYDPGDAKGHGFVLDVDTGTWVKWVLPRTVAGSCFAFDRVLMAGSYATFSLHENRQALAQPFLVGLGSFPSSSDAWPDDTVTITSVTGTGPYEVTIAAGSEWTPKVGDIFALPLGSGAAIRLVTGVTSATVFQTDVAITGSFPRPNVQWREAFECRCVWLATDEGNVGDEKQWIEAAFPFENSVLLSRYVSPTVYRGLLKSYFRGYRNTAAAIEAYVDTDQSIGLSTWPFAPAFKRVSVPSAFARDWALRVGFSIQQAGVWFSTAGLSMLYTPKAAGRVSR